MPAEGGEAPKLPVPPKEGEEGPTTVGGEEQKGTGTGAAETKKEGTKGGDGSSAKRSRKEGEDGDEEGEDGGEGPTDEQLLKKMKEIIDTHDLSELSMKKIRQMLETEFKVSLSKRKAWIKEEVDKLTAESDEDEEEEEEEEQPKKRQKKRDSRFGSLLSPEMQAFLGVEEMDRRSVVKELWKYIKENNLQDPKNKRKIMLDEKLSTIFKGTATGRLDMFKMNKQLSKHCYVAD